MKVGIIGLGFMGATNLKAFSAIDGVAVTAVSTNNPKALAGDLSGVGGNLGRETGQMDFSHVTGYRDWRDLVNDSSLDAVDICLPTDLHAPVARMALATGKHVLVEKPMALNFAECEAMLASAAARGRILMVAQVLRFWPEYLVLLDFVRNKPSGAVTSASFQRKCAKPGWSGWLADEARSGGAVFDLLVHDIDQTILLFGWPNYATGQDAGGLETMKATLEYESGAVVTVEGGWYEADTPFSMSFRADAPQASLELTADGKLLRTESGKSPEPVIPPHGDAYDAEVGYFVECCRTGKQPERCLPSDSALAVKLALLLKDSRTQGGKRFACTL